MRNAMERLRMMRNRGRRLKPGNVFVANAASKNTNSRRRLLRGPTRERVQPPPSPMRRAPRSWRECTWWTTPEIVTCGVEPALACAACSRLTSTQREQVPAIRRSFRRRSLDFRYDNLRSNLNSVCAFQCENGDFRPRIESHAAQVAETAIDVHEPAVT